MSLFCTHPDCDRHALAGELCYTHEKERVKAAKQALAEPKKRKLIRQVSEKKATEVSQYSKLKAEFIKGKTCPVYPHLPVMDIHHRRGKVGDLFLDTNYWLAVSRKGHMKIELNPKWAREMGYSLPRQ